MEKLKSKAIVTLFDRLYRMEPWELISNVFPEYPDDEKERLISVLINLGVANFLAQITDEHRPSLDNYLTHVYNEATVDFMVTVMAYHSKEDVQRHLTALGVKHKHSYITPIDLDNAIMRLTEKHLNFMLTWQPDGKRGILWLDNNNFKQK